MPKACIDLLEKIGQFVNRVVVLDAAHTTGRYPSKLFLACIMDPDNKIVPLAWGLAQDESTDSWSSFLLCLEMACPFLKEEQMEDPPSLVFVSDRAPGIAAAIHRTFPDAHHSLCSVHIERNFLKRYTNTQLEGKVDGLAKAATESRYTRLLIAMDKIEPGCSDFFEGTAHPSNWADHAFPVNRLGVTTSNSAESLNSKFGEYRDLPHSTMLMGLFRTLDDNFRSRHQKYQGRVEPITNYAVNKIEKGLALSAQFMVQPSVPNSRTQFTVRSTDRRDHGAFKLNLSTYYCECGEYQKKYIPCMHALAAITFLDEEPADYVPGHYGTEHYLALYNNFPAPPGPVQDWLEPSREATVPTVIRKRGRTRKKRIPSSGEAQVANVRRGPKRKNYCGNCLKQCGHNARSCRAEPASGEQRVAFQQEHGRPAPRGRAANQSNNMEEESEDGEASPSGTDREDQGVRSSRYRDYSVPVATGSDFE